MRRKIANVEAEAISQQLCKLSKGFNANHPELREDEVFLCNLEIEDLERSFSEYNWKTKRLGEKSYDAFGNPLEICRPLFISKKEWDESCIETVKIVRDAVAKVNREVKADI